MGHSDISWKFEIIGSWVGTGGQGEGPGIQAKVSTEFRRHGFPYEFCTSVSFVLRTKLSKISRYSLELLCNFARNAEVTEVKEPHPSTP